MQLSLRARVTLVMMFVLIAILVLFGIAKIVSFFTKKSVEPAPVVMNTKEQPVKQKTDVYDTSKIPFQKNEAPAVVKTKEERSALDAAAFVMPFVDRLGSYSNQSNFENLQDLLPFMTEEMQVWAKAKIQEAALKPIPTIYKGTTTKSFSYSNVQLDESKGTAEVTVSAQRKDFVGTGTNFKVYNQDVVVKLKKESKQWLVDSADWK